MAHGQKINPPDWPTRTYSQSTPEERQRAVELNKRAPGEYAAIARRLFREFGITRSPMSVKAWIKKEENA